MKWMGIKPNMSVYGGYDGKSEQIWIIVFLPLKGEQRQNRKSTLGNCSSSSSNNFIIIVEGIVLDLMIYIQSVCSRTVYEKCTHSMESSSIRWFSLSYRAEISLRLAYANSLMWRKRRTTRETATAEAIIVANSCDRRAIFHSHEKESEREIWAHDMQR